MEKKTSLLYGLFILLLVVSISGCGGSKETVNFEPEPDPFPPVNEPEQPEPATVTPEPPADIARKEPLILLAIHFDFDRSALTPEARALLAENAHKLSENPDVSVRIEGHCDERGTVEYNLALAERRALSVRNYIINYGISPNRLTIISYGKERPIDFGHTPLAWAQNRRAEFVIQN